MDDETREILKSFEIQPDEVELLLWVANDPDLTQILKGLKEGKMGVAQLRIDGTDNDKIDLMLRLGSMFLLRFVNMVKAAAAKDHIERCEDFSARIDELIRKSQAGEDITGSEPGA